MLYIQIIVHSATVAGTVRNVLESQFLRCCSLSTCDNTRVPSVGQVASALFETETIQDIQLVSLQENHGVPTYAQPSTSEANASSHVSHVSRDA